MITRKKTEQTITRTVEFTKNDLIKILSESLGLDLTQADNVEITITVPTGDYDGDELAIDDDGPIYHLTVTIMTSSSKEEVDPPVKS